MQNIEWLPEVFRFVEVQDTVNIPLVFQFIILEFVDWRTSSGGNEYPDNVEYAS